MKEIREYVFDTLEADPAIQGFTGYTASDKRIYLAWPPEDVELTSSLPAYMTYKLAISPLDQVEYVEDAQEDDILIELNVWANDPDIRDQLAERIGILFKDHSFYTTSFRVVYTKLEAKEDMEELHESTGQIISWRKFMQFLMGPIYRL